MHDAANMHRIERVTRYSVEILRAAGWNMIHPPEREYFATEEEAESYAATVAADERAETRVMPILEIRVWRMDGTFRGLMILKP